MKAWTTEAERLAAFPVAASQVFLAHAGVTALPHAAARAMADYAWAASREQQEFSDALRMIAATRGTAARIVEGDPDEVALLGPTSLGLSLFALGLDWQPGDEILCYRDDYPANVYPWMGLASKGVHTRFLEPDAPGQITPELVAASLTPRTRLVALASCHYLTGYRIDLHQIGTIIHQHGALFSLDAIQTIGAFPTPVEPVDFLSADAHKWMLGPMAIGIVYVKRIHFPRLHPILLGAANVRSPNFIAQSTIDLPDRASRYEPGVLNMSGIAGMHAALELLLNEGSAAIADRLLALKHHLVTGLQQLGFTLHGPVSGPNASAITTVSLPGRSLTPCMQALQRAGVVCSLRHDRAGQAFLRFSPHFYNTKAELDRTLNALEECLRGM